MLLVRQAGSSYNQGRGLILSNFTILADIKNQFLIFGLYSNSVSISCNIQIYGQCRAILCTLKFSTAIIRRLEPYSTLLNK
jgi:hypothetical protein